MCRQYTPEPGETVFQYLLWSPVIFVGLIFVVVGVAVLIAFKNAPSAVFLIVPIVLIAIGSLIVVGTGGRWVVFNESTDSVHVVKGYLFNVFFRKLTPGKLSELTAVLITIRITTNRHHSSDSSISSRRTSTSISYDTTLHFSSGATRLVANDTSQSRASDFVVKIKEWLDTHRPNHGVKCGSSDQFSGNVIIQTVVNPNQLAEQELRSLIIQYQSSSDMNAQAKGQKFNLAMEYNSASLVGTYVALKQQNPVFTVQSEDLLLNNAQTIIDAKTGVTTQQVQQPQYILQQQYPQQPMYTQQQYS